MPERGVGLHESRGSAELRQAMVQARAERDVVVVDERERLLEALHRLVVGEDRRRALGRAHEILHRPHPVVAARKVVGERVHGFDTAPAELLERTRDRAVQFAAAAG